MIPKIIHYIWLGSAEKPDLVKNCIASWEKECPEYEVVEWNDFNTKNIQNKFFREAVQNKKWAFASDFLRLYVLERFGGFYVDSDLEIRRNLDGFLKYDFVTGYERPGYPITALMGSCSGNGIIRVLLEYYDDRPFVLPDGRFDMKTNTAIISGILNSRYSVPIDKKSGRLAVEISQKEVIFPVGTFCQVVEGEENYSVHHFNGSWVKDVLKTVFCIGPFKVKKLKKHRRDCALDWGLDPNEKLLFHVLYNPRRRKFLGFVVRR